MSLLLFYQAYRCISHRTRSAVRPTILSQTFPESLFEIERRYLSCFEMRFENFFLSFLKNIGLAYLWCNSALKYPIHKYFLFMIVAETIY